MIVWGGLVKNDSNDIGSLNTGGRYNPSTDTWMATNTTGAPAARSGHTAVWTGSEMIVWSGAPFGVQSVKTGGRYNSTTDAWTATNTTGAPAARGGHTAVWTGTEMIVWGGWGLNDGSRYNPANDMWDTLAPAFMELGATNFLRQTYINQIWQVRQRSSHTAIWTGASIFLYGGNNPTTSLVEFEIITPGRSYLYSKP
jgi:hypothetical protein